MPILSENGNGDMMREDKSRSPLILNGSPKRSIHNKSKRGDKNGKADGNGHEPISENRESTGDPSSPQNITPDTILTEARMALEHSTKGRKDKFPTEHDDRRQQIIQQALNKAVIRDTPTVRSTRDVLKLAGKVLPGADTTPVIAATFTEDELEFDKFQPLATDGTFDYPRKYAMARCTSPSLSDVGSMEDYEQAMRDLPSKFSDQTISREKMLKRIDGIDSHPPQVKLSFDQENHLVDDPTCGQELFAMFSTICSGNILSDEPSPKAATSTQRPFRESMVPVASVPSQLEDAGEPAVEAETEKKESNIYISPSIISEPSIARVRSEPPPAFHESANTSDVDPRMPTWVSSQMKAISEEESTSEDSFFSLGSSRTVIVHEIVRGHWTWCTAWSPDGCRLAIGTENHHLAVVEASQSTVWRVRHDRRITDPIKNDTTHTIRSIAWGSQFIAIGGTGTAVTILSPIEPYPALHTITKVGFVGALSWKPDSAILAIGSREDRCVIVRVSAVDDEKQRGPGGRGRKIVSEVIHTVHRRDWVNAVKFSPGGSVLAIGDGSGRLTVYNHEAAVHAEPKIDNITDFVFDDAILNVEWARDGKWLYAGGEDFTITVIDTALWQVTQRIQRDRWVQFIAASNRGTHLAVGGVASEVTLLDVNDGWKAAMQIELKGLVPLSAQWHPRDQFLVMTGQDDSVIAVETTNARLVDGHYLKSASPIEMVEFSPDGDMLAVGNNSGIVTFYKSSGRSFVTAYEMVLAMSYSQSIKWSPNGSYVVVGSGNSLVVITKTNPTSRNSSVPPKTSGFGVRKVMRDLGRIASVSIHVSSRYIAVSGSATSVLDAGNDFVVVQRWDDRELLANAWSPDGTWLATVGRSQNLTILDTSGESVSQWRVVFTLQASCACHALAWGPPIADGLQYMAYGGDDKKVTIIEVRTYEATWETVLEVERQGAIHGLDWSKSGLLAVAIGDGTVSIIDLAYLRSGVPVNEMDYNWQRQGITCFTEIRRNRVSNVMSTVRWIPGTLNESLLAIGGTDGVLEVIDLTERQKCKAFGGPIT